MNKEDYFKYYIQGSDHYLIPKDVFDELFDEIEQLQQENKQLKIQISAREEVCNRLESNWNKLKEYIRKNIIYDDVGMKILDPSPLEDYIQELEQGSDSK